MSERCREMTIEATAENIDKVTAFVDAQLEAMDCPMKVQMQLDVAIDELFSNIAHYAYQPEVGMATVRMGTLDEPLAVVITLIDQGRPFNPLAKPDPDVTLSIEERGVGGLGIYIVKKSMDAIAYTYQDGKNILKIQKNIG